MSMESASFSSEVLAYIEEEYGVKPEFLWAKSPNNAAIRHEQSKKWFAALLLDMPRKTVGLRGDGCVDILNVKCDPRVIGSLIDGEKYLRGYHMNKEHWLSIVLDGSAPLADICALVYMSYELTKPKIKKKSPSR